MSRRRCEDCDARPGECECAEYYAERECDPGCDHHNCRAWSREFNLREDLAKDERRGA